MWQQDTTLGIHSRSLNKKTIIAHKKKNNRKEEGQNPRWSHSVSIDIRKRKIDGHEITMPRHSLSMAIDLHFTGNKMTKNCCWWYWVYLCFAILSELGFLLSSLFASAVFFFWFSMKYVPDSWIYKGYIKIVSSILWFETS
jgi:hypothetical protein